jgi:hypothetical protein
MTGLTQGTSYTFTVTATNSAGTGSPSAASNSITTFATPVNTVAPVVSGTATVGQTLSTTNGTWTGTATITYTYQWQRNGVDIGSATSSTYTLVNADAGNPVRCVVTGTNSYGNSSANSNATANVAAIAPGAPTIGTATATGTTTATVAFTAPASNGGATITTYTATSSPGNITGTLSQAGSGTITVTGLSQGTSYTFTVTATNSAGTGSASSASNSITTFATPVNTVAPVVSGTATVGQTLSTTNGTWTGTATITYTYQWQRAGVDIGSATSSTYTLVNADASNPIRCVVTGTNSYGNSSANSNATANVAAIVPGAPTIGVATATGDSTATVAFTAPASNGGATITSYTATSSPAGGTGTLSQAGSGTISVTGLTQGTTYTFTVTATNSVGTGSASSASNSITTTASYFNYNTLLLPGASTTFVDDASTNNFAVTINGDTKPNSMNPYSPGYYSGYFAGGASDYVTASAGSSQLNLPGDFTVELWFYATESAKSLPQFAYSANGGFGCGINSYDPGTRRVDWRQVGTAPIYGATVVTSNTWHHVAYVKSGSTFKIFLDGILDYYNGSYTTTFTTTASYIGSANNGDANYSFTGYISNFRVVKGTAVYTTASTTIGATIFTPSATPLTAISNTALLTCQSNRFIDNSTNALALTVTGSVSINSFQPFTPNSSYSTYGSGYFDGTGDYLTVPQNAAFNFGTGDFTVEGWWNFTSIAADQCLVMLGTGANVPNPKCAWWLRYQSSGTLSFYRYDGAVTENNFTLPSALTTNTWYHIACTRSGTSLKMFVNGVAVGTTITSSLNFDNVDSDPLVIGRVITGGGTYYANGYYSDVRIVKGTAVYTTAFTPPTTPLTAISGTSLLTLQNNQSVNNNVFLDNSSNNFLVTRNGNTTQGTFSPYGGNWSNYFDATYIQTPAGSTTAIIGGTGAITPTSTFTVECWIYQTQRHTGASQPILIGDQGTNGSLYWTFGPDTTGKLAFYVYTGSQVLSTGNDTIPLNTWTHIAMSINSGAIKLFVNGNLQTITGATTTGTQTGTFGYLLTGGFYTFTGGYAYIGYLSNLRIVKSALYSTTFTPSTTPLTPVTNTGLLTCQSSSFIDNSLNKFALTTGSTLSVQRFSPFNPSSVTPTSYSGYFDGTGDVLNITGAAGPEGTQDFTWESWWYFTSLGGQYPRIFEANTASGFQIYSDSGTFGVASNGGSIIVSYDISALTNQWLHLCVTRSGSAMRLFVNGVLRAYSASGGTNFASSTDWRVYSEGSGPIGYLSNMRVVRGSVVAGYVTASTTTGTTIFTPPTSPLTAISGTSLLTCQSPTFIDNSTNNFPITTAGNTQPLTQNPFGYTSATTQGYTVSTIGGSGYFDGTGDYLSIPNNDNIVLGSSNYTIQLWVYPISSASPLGMISKGNSNSVGADFWSIEFSNTAGGFSFYCGAYNGGSAILSGTAPLNTWTHITVVRNSLVHNLYVNGVSVSTATAGSTYTVTSAGSLYIGTGSYAPASRAINGYISDARIIKAQALYTSNFVPPSQPLTAVQNTTFLSNMTSGGIIDYTMMTNSETVGNASLSTTVTKFGATSLYFDGTGDYLTSPNSTNFDFGSGNFTIQLWLYLNVTTDQNIIAKWWTGGQQWVLQFRQAGQDSIANQHWRFVANNGSTAATDFTEASTTSVATSTWYHIALTRSGSSYKLFRDGTQVGSTYTNAAAITATTDPLTIGQFRNDGTAYLNGYVDDLSITKGYAVYTSNFTPPTGPLPTY